MAVRVTAVHVAKGAKFVSVETADGARETLRLTGRASQELGKGSTDAARGTAYVADDAGNKVVHFFEWRF